MQNITVRGVSDPNHLRRFFRDKGHPFVVIQTGQVLDMPLEQRATLLDVLYKAGVTEQPSGAVPEDAYRHRIQCLGVQGYVRVAVADLCNRLSIHELQGFQEWMHLYREIRAAKYEPTKLEVCDCTQQTKTAKPRCPMCGGSGELVVLVEMSDQEIALAEGKSIEEAGV